MFTICFFDLAGVSTKFFLHTAIMATQIRHNPPGAIFLLTLLPTLARVNRVFVMDPAGKGNKYYLAYPFPDVLVRLPLPPSGSSYVALRRFTSACRALF